MTANKWAAGMPTLRFTAYAATATASAAGVIKNISSLDSGFYHNCAIFPSMTLANGYESEYFNNVTVTGAKDSKAVVTTANASVRCWGQNLHNQLGSYDSQGPGVDSANLNALIRKVEADVPVFFGPAVITAVKTGGFHTCALGTQGAISNALLCWGENDDGQLGVNPMDMSESILPTVAMGDGVSAFDVGGFNTGFIRNGAFKMFGQNMYGQNGTGNSPMSDYDWMPQIVVGGRTGVTAFTMGALHACGVFGANNTVKCWGDNSGGAVGDGVTDIDVNPNYPNVLAPTAVVLSK